MADTFTVDELAAYPGVTGSPETIALVTETINDLIAETMEAQGVTTPAQPARVKRLALVAASRTLINPEGATTRSIQLDDYKETVVLPDSAVAYGAEGIGFTPGEMGRLVTFLTGRQQDRASIPLTVPGFPRVCTAADGWLPS